MNDPESKPRLPWSKTAGVLCAAFLFIAVAGIGTWWWTRQPMYKGELVSYWVDKVCGPHDNIDAARVITEIGPPAIPYLVAKLKLRDTPFRKLWLKAYDVLPAALADYLPQPDYGSSARAMAINYLGLLGLKAKPAVPELVQCLGDTNEEIFICTAEALGRIGPGAASAAPQLQQFLTRGSLDLQGRVVAGMALWRIDGRTNAAMYGRLFEYENGTGHAFRQ